MTKSKNWPISEHSIQTGIVHYLHHALNGLPATFFAVPNGSSRKKKKVGKTTISIEGQRLKMEGVVAGVADLIVIYAGRVIGFEVKTKTGKMSKSQKDWKPVFENAGGVYFVVRSIDDVCDALQSLQVPIKARPSSKPGHLYDRIGERS